jgi:tight adherence protein B
LPQNLLIVAVAATVFLGAALFSALITDRRRQAVQRRLQQIAPPTPGRAEPPTLLMRPLSEVGPRRGLVLADVRRRFDMALAATGDRIRFVHLAVAGAVAAVAAIALSLQLLSLNPFLAVVIGVAAALAAATTLVRLMQAHYQDRFLDIFPEALDLVARAVRAGLPVFDALDVAAREIRDPVGGEFRRIIDEMRIGGEVEEALQHAADRVRVPDFRFFVVTVTLQRRTGGHLAETLGNLSNIIRRRKEVRLKARALTSEARASAVVLTLLPLFIAFGLVLVDRPLMQSLWLDPRGRFMVGLAIISLATGSLVMRLMIRRALR